MQMSTFVVELPTSDSGAKLKINLIGKLQFVKI